MSLASENVAQKKQLPVLSRLFTLKRLFLLRIICEVPAVAYITSS